jgi:segregation and condensation protein B
MKKKKKEEKVIENVELTTLEESIEEVTIRVSSVEAEALEPAVEVQEEVVAVAAEEDKNLISDINEIESAILALVFASPVALSLKKIKKLLSEQSYDVSQVELLLESLTQSFTDKGIQFLKVAGGYQLRSHPKFTTLLQKLVDEKPQRLSKSAMELLAIVAYKQPITRADIDNVRGTDSGHLLKGLLEKNLIRTEGHKETAGRPMLYGTTPYFLEVFSLGSLDDLPAIEDFERELKDADATILEADPDFFDKPNALDADADRGSFDDISEEVVDAPDFGVQERALEELNAEA